MRQWFLGVAVMAALVGGAGCRRAKSLPTRTAPSGTLVIRFTRPLLGQLELTLDGTRIPVEAKGKKLQELTVTGLSAGRHRYFITSPRDAFGPDQGEVEFVDGQGVFLTAFSQKFDSVLYGKPDPLPAPEGLPGVKALLSK